MVCDYLVVYDFQVSTGNFPRMFSYHSNKLLSDSSFSGDRIQKSVWLCHDENSANRLAELARRYGGLVRTFKVEESAMSPC